MRPERLTEAERLRDAIGLVAVEMARAREWPRAVETVLHLAQDALQADAVALWQADADVKRLRLVAQRGLPEAKLAPVREVSYDAPLLVARAAREEQVQLVERVEDLPAPRAGTPFWEGLGFRSLVVVPLPGHGRLAGVMVCLTFTPRRYQQAELAAIGTIANLLGLGLENAWLHTEHGRAGQERERLLERLGELNEHLTLASVREREQRQKAEATTARLQALQAVSEAALARLSWGDLLHELLRRARKALAADTACILLVSEDGRYLDVRACDGLEAEVEARGRMPVGQGFAGRIAAGRQPMIAPDLSEEDMVGPFPREHVRSLIGAPLVVDDRAIGVVRLGTVRRRTFTEDDLRLLQLVADRVALAIDRVRLFDAQRAARAEAERRAAELDTALSAIPDGVIIYGPQAEVLRMNQAGAEILGIAAEQFGPMPPAERVARLRDETPDGRPIRSEQTPGDRALRGETVAGFRMVIHRPDGTARHVLASAAPIRDVQGRVIGAVSSFSDVTALRELERQREEWTSIIAHDLRQPVTIITGYASLLARLMKRPAVPPEEQQRAVEHIHTSARQLNRMIADLLDVSRVEAGRLVVERQTVDLAALVGQVLERTAEVTQGHPVRLEIAGDLPPVPADPQRLEQVLGNLLSNAAKYGDPDTEIVVELARREAEVEVAVTNRGQGILPEDLPSIFARFHRTRQARAERVPGLGLGLYISTGLVEAHGGRIWAESTPGQTTTFRFTLPLSAQQGGHGRSCAATGRRVRWRGLAVMGAAAVCRM